MSHGKFRKKPVVIEAVQYFHDLHERYSSIPVWLNQTAGDSVLFSTDSGTFIRTLEGIMEVKEGDWIIRGIRGIKGELYPCKPDIFEETYERVIE